MVKQHINWKNEYNSLLDKYHIVRKSAMESQEKAEEVSDLINKWKGRLKQLEQEKKTYIENMKECSSRSTETLWIGMFNDVSGRCRLVEEIIADLENTEYRP